MIKFTKSLKQTIAIILVILSVGSTVAAMPSFALVENGDINPSLLKIFELHANYLASQGNETAIKALKLYQEGSSLPIKDKSGNSSLQKLNAWQFSDAFAQEYMMRPPQTDHYDIQDKKIWDLPYQSKALFLYKNLGLVTEIMPHQLNGSYVLAVFGGSPIDTLERFKGAVHLIDDLKANISEIYYINGLRKLDDKEKDNFQALFSLPAPVYQHEAAIIIWEKILKRPEKLISTPLKPEDFVGKDNKHYTAEKSAKRINTEHTVKHLLSQKMNQHIIFVSNAPYGPYQAAIVEKIATELGLPLSSKENLITIAPKGEERSTIVYNDTLARRIYTMLDQQKLPHLKFDLNKLR